MLGRNRHTCIFAPGQAALFASAEPEKLELS